MHAWQGDISMTKLVTSDQFVAGIVAVLALRNLRQFRLSDTELDGKFQEAFRELVAAEARYDVRPNFSFYVDPQHGDSVCLRETLTAAKEKELVAFNNPTLRTFDVKLSDERAHRYLDRGPLPREFLEQIVDTYFTV
jgi:hypothetical protein